MKKIIGILIFTIPFLLLNTSLMAYEDDIMQSAQVLRDLKATKAGSGKAVKSGKAKSVSYSKGGDPTATYVAKFRRHFALNLNFETVLGGGYLPPMAGKSSGVAIGGALGMEGFWFNSVSLFLQFNFLTVPKYAGSTANLSNNQQFLVGGRVYIHSSFYFGGGSQIEFLKSGKGAGLYGQMGGDLHFTKHFSIDFGGNLTGFLSKKVDKKINFTYYFGVKYTV